MSKSIVFIDYENVQSIDDNIVPMYSSINIIVGVDQVKIPFQLVQKLQAYGEKIKWTQVHGKGKNALDFLLAYYVGLTIAQNEYDEYFIYSKDKGYDPLVKHITETGFFIKRIETFKSTPKILPNVIKVKKTKAIVQYTNAEYKKVIENIKNVDTEKRPKTHVKLHGHIKTVFGNKKTDEAVESMIEQLLSDNFIMESDKKLEYKI